MDRSAELLLPVQKVCRDLRYSPFDDLARFSLGLLLHAASEQQHYGLQNIRGQFLSYGQANGTHTALYEQTVNEVDERGRIYPIDPNHPSTERISVFGNAGLIRVGFTYAHYNSWHGDLYFSRDISLATNGHMSMVTRQKNDYKPPRERWVSNPNYSTYLGFMALLTKFKVRGEILFDEETITNLLH